MAKDRGTRDVSQQPWLVSARCDVQYLLFDIRFLLDKIRSDRDKASMDDVYRARVVLESAFCLWRAVFLIKDTFSPVEILDDMDYFLNELVDNNTILYIHDKNSSRFAGSFYLRTAILRLNSIIDIEPDDRERLLPKQISIEVDAAFSRYNELTQNQAGSVFNNYQDRFDLVFLTVVELVKSLFVFYKIQPIRIARPSVRIAPNL